MGQQSGGQLRPGINVRVNNEYPKHCKLYMIQQVMQSKRSGCLLDAPPSYPSKSLLSWSQKAWMLLQSVSLLRGFVALSEM